MKKHPIIIRDPFDVLYPGHDLTKNTGGISLMEIPPVIFLQKQNYYLHFYHILFLEKTFPKTLKSFYDPGI